jgi:hypothetical protein
MSDEYVPKKIDNDYVLPERSPAPPAESDKEDIEWLRERLFKSLKWPDKYYKREPEQDPDYLWQQPDD